MILSIESSCDDSSIAITQIATKKLLFHKKISQENLHAKYGGVVPELAARLHAKALPDILEQCKEFFPFLKAIAVTNEPGLSVSLIEGVSMAKALAISLHLPLLAINHLKGHIYSLFIEQEEKFPLRVLLVSGGHTQILDVRTYDDINLIATTLDDSFGESFDKVAKMLHMPYPGGPVVEKLAKNGDQDRFGFTIPLYNSNQLAFSYSGLKNQVRLAIESLGADLSEQDKADICASFQKTAIEHLKHKIKQMLKSHAFSDFAIVGGASANETLREAIKSFGFDLRLAPLKYCSDNAAMIGRAALKAYELGHFADPNHINIRPKIK